MKQVTAKIWKLFDKVEIPAPLASPLGSFLNTDQVQSTL